MSNEEEIEQVLRQQLGTASLDDDVLSYLITVISEMSVEERRSSEQLQETIVPFLIDAGAVSSEEEGAEHCKRLVIAFGGSGYKSGGAATIDDATPMLLSAPVKIKDKTEIHKKATYGGVVFTSMLETANAYDSGATNGSAAAGSSAAAMDVNHNSSLDASIIPTTQKQARKMRKESERVQRILRAEEVARLEAEAEMASARMAAIRANRSNSRKAASGANIERFSIPHPSGTGDLLTDASILLAGGRRYGLIGRNGAGKSTLMRQLANYKLEGLMHLRILLVDQHVEGDADSAMQWVLRADVERTSLLEDEQRLLQRQAEIAAEHCSSSNSNGSSNGNAHGSNSVGESSSSNGSDMSNKSKSKKTTTSGSNTNGGELADVNIDVALQEVYERMESIGVQSAPQRAMKILRGLGFTDAMMLHPTNGLSGGWAMRAALAAALFVKPDLLLLDEPTNHLDLHALVWLENWLTVTFAGIALIVSHDEVFLNNVCTDIYEFKSTLVGHQKSELIHYAGDYAAYENTKQEQKVAQIRLREQYEKEKEKLQEFISREGKKYDNPSHQAQRKMKMKQLQSLMEVDAVQEESELVMRLPTPFGVFGENENLVNVRNAAFGWDEQNMLFSDVDFVIGSHARIVILGKNGCGKTSLLNIIVGEQEPSRGAVDRHLGCRIARLQQHHYKGEQLDPNLNALEHMRRLPQEESTAVGLHDPDTRQEETAQRSFLSNFGIRGNKAVLPVRYLSGGQRMRVAMAVALYRRPDLLILDEPTNHLDSDTVRALCAALSTYQGAIIAVSHDEAFVNQVTNSATAATAVASGATGAAAGVVGELWVMSRQRLRRFDGSFRDYKRAVMQKVLRGEHA